VSNCKCVFAIQVLGTPYGVEKMSIFDGKPCDSQRSVHYAQMQVFDFDHTIMDDNTDGVVQEVAHSGALPKEVKAVARNEGWTAFMRSVFEHLHSKGVTESQILHKIDQIPFVKHMKDCLVKLRAWGGEVIIISDSNTVFIDRILAGNADLRGVFEEVFTNPASWDSSGKLNIEPFHHNEDCELSGVNLCKGTVLEDYLKR